MSVEGSARGCGDKKRYVLLECGRGGNLVVGGDR